MANSESNHRTAYTPIKKSMIFQKKRDKKQIIDENTDRFTSYDVVFNGREVTVKYDSKTDEIIINGKLYPTTVVEENGFFTATVSEEHKYRIEHHDGQIFLEGRLIEFDLKQTMPKLNRIKSSKKGEEIIKAPLPGQVVSINVKLNDQVVPGQSILTLEAMKMQNEISTQIEGKVLEIYIMTGYLVKTGDQLVLIGKSIS